jgi:NADH:ubiquinone oxidoreductase subunit 6 (subunit J)
MRLILISLLSFLTIVIATFIFFSYSTVHILLTFILFILSLSSLLLSLGAEFFAIIYTLVYIGVVLVFFIFVILLIDLRYEIRNVELSSIVYASPVNVFFSILFFFIASIILDLAVCDDFTNLEELSLLRAGDTNRI